MNVKIVWMTLFILCNSIVSASPIKTIDLGNGIKVSIIEKPFIYSDHKIENCVGSNIPCLIDGHFPYGTAFNLPKSKLDKLLFEVGSSTYQLETKGMYNAWGTRPLEYKGKIRYLGAHCYNERNCTLRGLFSDAAGFYVAEWRIIEGMPHRTILSSSDDVMILFMKNIQPPHNE